jgi:signal transduction histidine kinase
MIKASGDQSGSIKHLLIVATILVFNQKYIHQDPIELPHGDIGLHGGVQWRARWDAAGSLDMTADDKAQQSILIIDDSEDDRDVFQRLLRQAPEADRIYMAETSKEGLRLFETEQPTCVLLDYNLPGYDGLETLERIKAIDRYASVVMLTGEGSEDVAVAAMKAGASDYVVKDTISAVGLRRAVTNAIDKMRLQQKVDSQQEEKELFIKTLVHDAKAPLRHISTFSQFLDADIEAGDLSGIREYCGDIRIATKRIEDLLDTLASYALSESEVTFEPVCMNDVVDAVLDNLAHQIEARHAVVRHEALPTITGHKPQLIQLLQNLIGNGIKYCEAGQPEVDITVTASDEDAGPLFSVRDNGIGIPEDKLAYVFQPFKRLWSQDVYEGTGLGLAICEKIVKRHGGRIWCESQHGRGSAFCFTLGHAVADDEEQRLAS